MHIIFYNCFSHLNFHLEVFLVFTWGNRMNWWKIWSAAEPHRTTGYKHPLANLFFSFIFLYRLIVGILCKFLCKSSIIKPNRMKTGFSKSQIWNLENAVPYQPFFSIYVLIYDWVFEGLHNQRGSQLFDTSKYVMDQPIWFFSVWDLDSELSPDVNAVFLFCYFNSTDMVWGGEAECGMPTGSSGGNRWNCWGSWSLKSGHWSSLRGRFWDEDFKKIAIEFQSQCRTMHRLHV